MHKSKLFKVLKVLEAEEIEELSHFVACPLFNTNARCGVLLSLLRPFLEDEQEVKIDKKKIFSQIYPTKKYGPSLAVLMSDLLRLVEDFLIFKGVGEERYERQRFLMKAYIKRGASSAIIDGNYQKTKQLYDHQTRIEMEEQLSFLGINKVYFQHIQHTSPERVGDLANGLIKGLDKWAILQRLRFYLYLINLRNVQVSVLDEEEVTRVLEEVRRAYPASDHPLVFVLYKAIEMLLKETEEAHFKALGAFLEENFRLIPQNSLIELYAIMTNYCIRRVQGGNLDYLKELLAIYKIMVARKALYIGKFLPIGRFRNIVSLGCQLKDFEWTENFILGHIDKISLDQRSSIRAFSLATIQFYQGDFDKTIYHLNEMANSPADNYYELNRRFLLLKSFYELGETIAFYSNASTFKAYVRTTKKISALNKKGYYHFTNLLLRVYKVKIGDSKPSALAGIKRRIEKYEHLSDKRWLLEKIDELE